MYIEKKRRGKKEQNGKKTRETYIFFLFSFLSELTDLFFFFFFLIFNPDIVGRKQSRVDAWTFENVEKEARYSPSNSQIFLTNSPFPRRLFDTRWKQEASFVGKGRSWNDELPLASFLQSGALSVVR